MGGKNNLPRFPALFQSRGMSIKKKAFFTTVIYQSMALYVLLICMTEF